MKVLMIDDHPLILTAMQNVVRGLGDHVRVNGVETLAEARALLVDGHDFDLVLLDLFLGEQDGYAFLMELRAAHPGLPVVIVSASERPADMIRCIDGGAMGFVPKRATTEMLFEALMLVMAGGIYVPEMVSGLGGPDLPSLPDEQVYPGLPAPGEPSLANAGAAGGWAARRSGPALSTGIPLGASQPPARPVVGPSTLESLGLTPRQSEVLMLLLEGKANKVIAREMGLSVETVKDHVAAVLRCLGVASRMQAVVAVRHLLGPGGSGSRA